MNRLSLRDGSVNGLKTVRETVQKFGVQRVPINASLVNDVKQAHILKMQEEREEKRKRIEEENKAFEAQAVA